MFRQQQSFQNVVDFVEGDDDGYSSGGSFSPEPYDFGNSSSSSSSSITSSPTIITKPAGPVRLSDGSQVKIDFTELERRMRYVCTTFFVSEYDPSRGDSAHEKPFRILFVTHANHILPAIRQLAEEVRSMTHAQTIPAVVSVAYVNTTEKQELLRRTQADLAFMCVAKARKFWPRTGDPDDVALAGEFVGLLKNTNNNTVGVVMDDSSDVDQLDDSQLVNEYPHGYAKRLKSGFKINATATDANQSHIYTMPVLYLGTQEVNENGNIGRRISPKLVVNEKNIKAINERVHRAYNAWYISNNQDTF